MADGSEQWTGRAGFVLATIGSAIGLGSIWKFPYEVGENGGGAFVVFYLAGLVAIVAPLMLAEFAIGRYARADAQSAIETVAQAHGATRRWSLVGALGVIVAALILSFYSVIGGWALAYAVETLWTGLPGATAAEVQDRFDAFLTSPLRMGLYHTIFILTTALIVGRGIANGIEAATRVLMPLLVVLMLALAAYSLITGDAARTFRYLFSFDTDHITTKAILEAVGLGFFSIGVGMAVMITYAAYAGPEINLRSAAVAAIAGDTAISFLAGFAIFPVVFANGLDPAGGPGLMFVTLPVAFAAIPGGRILAVVFFALLSIAALASAMSLLEMPAAFVRRSRNWPRPRAVAVTATVIWLAGFLSVFSFNLWRDWFPLSPYPLFSTATFFDLIDYISSNILLPLGGLLLAVFAGWKLPDAFFGEILGLGRVTTALLRVALRYVAPIGIAAATLTPLLGS